MSLWKYCVFMNHSYFSDMFYMESWMGKHLLLALSLICSRVHLLLTAQNETWDKWINPFHKFVFVLLGYTVCSDQKQPPVHLLSPAASKCLRNRV